MIIIPESPPRSSGFPVWIILPALLFVLSLTIGFNGLYGQDSFEYLRYSRALHEYINGGIVPGSFFWPVFYPLAGTFLSFLLPDILSLQLISIACFGFTSFFLMKILRHLFPEKQEESKIYLLVFFCLSPFILRYSLTVMSEPMALFFITAFFYCYLVFTESKKYKYFLGLVFFGCAAINTRYPAFVIMVIPVMHALYVFVRNFRLTVFLYSLLIMVLMFYLAFRLNLYEPGSIFGRLDLGQWSIGNYFQRTFLTADGVHSYMLPNICYVFSYLIHPEFIFSGMVLLILIRRKHLKRIFIRSVFLVIIVYALFLAGLTFQNDRVLILAFPLLLIIFSGPFLTLTERMKDLNPGLKKLFIISVMLIQVVLFYEAFRPFYRNNQITHAMADKMLKYPGKKIYTFNIDMALKGYGVKNETISLWRSKLDFFEPHALVLFNFAATKKQWQGMNPMLNWETLKRYHHLKVLENFPEGWNLYEID